MKSFDFPSNNVFIYSTAFVLVVVLLLVQPPLFVTMLASTLCLRRCPLLFVKALLFFLYYFYLFNSVNLFSTWWSPNSNSISESSVLSAGSLHATNDIIKPQISGKGFLFIFLEQPFFTTVTQICLFEHFCHPFLSV